MEKATSRLAIPVFRSRVAPVLNWCSTIRIFSEETTTLGREITLPNMSAFDRLKVLQDEGVQTVICGALSPDLLRYGESIGLQIIPGVAGEISDVIEAYRAEALDQPCFWIPGCRGRSGRCPGRQCVCPRCGAVAPHERGIPCARMSCPRCKGPMTRA